MRWCHLPSLVAVTMMVSVGCGLSGDPTDTGVGGDTADVVPADNLDSDAVDVRMDAPAVDTTGDISLDVPDAVQQPLYLNDGQHLRDSQGRAIILRGINFPSEDVGAWSGRPADQDRTDLQFIAASGFNAVRLVINWDRIEPEPDQYDAAYIALVARHARLAWEAGLFVIVDLHQDMYGVGFGLHGAPRWTCDEANYESWEPVGTWFLNYYSKEVSACFDGFWKDTEIQSHHQRAARELALSLVDIDGVVGFDPHNEPFPGTITFEKFERDYLGPFYDTFGSVVGEVLPGRIVFFEPAVVFSVQQDTSFATPAVAPQKLFFPHYYNMTVETAKQWDGNVGVDRDWVNAAAKQAARIKVPWGLGEMGGAVETTNLDAFLLAFYGLLDEAQAASFLWLFTRGTGGFGLVDETTNDWHPVARAFLRPAPSAVAGTPTTIHWDADTRTFDLAWDEDPTAGDSEVIIPAWVAEAGYTVRIDGVDAVPLASGRPGRATVPGGVGGSRTLQISVSGPYPGNG